MVVAAAVILEPMLGSALAGPLAGLLYNLSDILFWFSSSLQTAPLARHEGAMALVKLPVFSFIVLVGEGS